MFILTGSFTLICLYMYMYTHMYSYIATMLVVTNFLWGLWRTKCNIILRVLSI